MIGFLVLTVLVVGSFLAIKSMNQPDTPARPPWLHVDVLYVPIRPDGHEAFTSDPLMRGRVYQVQITGTIPYWELGWLQRQMDAAYRTDAAGNFTVRHKCLKIVGMGDAEGWEEDRAGHRYSFLIDGSGQRQSVRLSCPDNGQAQSIFGGSTHEPLMISFAILPAGTPTVADRQSARERLKTKTPVQPPPRSGVDLDIPACDVDVHSSVLSLGAVYRLKFRGTYPYDGCSRADAAYHTDSSGGFGSAYGGLRLDGNSPRQQDSWHENRSEHEFSCLIEGRGKRLCFCLHPPVGHASPGGLTVNIERMPDGTKTARMLEAEEIAKAAESMRAAEQQRAAADRERKVQEFKLFVHHHGNFLDAEFRQAYVRKYQEQILREWRSAWTSEYDTIHADAEMVKALENAAPEVLRWHDARIAMIRDAERAQVIPEKPAKEPVVVPRQITATTMGHVSQCIQELFQFTEMFDKESLALALDKNGSAHEPKLSRAIAGMAYCYKDLKRFGIDADSPEAAEIQFFQLCPPPAPTVYEELIQKLKKRKSVPPDALCERLEDLHREKIILQAQRRASIRQGDDQERDEIDRRLSDVRREATEIKAFLEAIKVPVEFKDRHEREQELSLEEKYIRLYSGKKRVLDFLSKEGDAQAVENVEALYAQEQAKLFEQDSSYS